MTPWTLFRSHRSTGLALAATAALGGVLEAVFLVFITRSALAVTDGDTEVGIIGDRTLGVGRTLLIAVLMIVVRVLLATWSGFRAARLSVDVTAQLQRDITQSYLSSDWATQQASSAGSLQYVLTQAAGAAAAMVTNVTAAIAAGFSLAALLGMAVFIDPPGSALVLVALVVLGAAIRPLRELIRRRGRAAAADSAAVTNLLAETSSLGVELHVFGVQRQAAERMIRQIDTGAASWRRLAAWRTFVPIVYAGLAYLVLVGAVGAVRLSDQSNITSLGPVLLLMLRSLTYGQQMQVVAASVAAERPKLDQMSVELARFGAGQSAVAAYHVAQINELRLDGVSFAYDGDDAVLTSISTSVRRGEMVGIVGPSGSGKSTLVQLMLGIRSPTSGVVSVDDVDMQTVDRATLVRRITFVPQHARLIVGTVAENIRFLRRDIADADVERAARLAHLHDDIVDHPDGYQRLLGSSGGDLSGGQAQRLCIARALVERPDVLILDEPTSALDGRSEQLIKTTLEDLRKQMAVVIIAHRMSTLETCDRLIVVQKGELVATGSPAELRQHNVFYRQALETAGLLG
jgi:ATP-binding cassette, subfamily B, bacterial